MIKNVLTFDMRPKNFRFLFWGAGLLTVFLGLLFLETRGIFTIFDPSITNLFQTAIPRVFDVPLSILTLLGSTEVTLLFIFAIAFLIFRREKRIYWALAFFGLIFVFEFLGKMFLYHPGPPAVYFRFALPFNLPTAFVQTRYSFPSGHVSRTIFLVVMGLFLIARYVKIPNQRFLLSVFCYLLVALMIISRIYLGEHWASDVLGGILLGGSMGLFALVYY